MKMTTALWDAMNTGEEMATEIRKFKIKITKPGG